MTEHPPIIQDGERFSFYAGPFHDESDAYDFIDGRIEYGALIEGEAIVVEGNVYRREAER